jgi:hypothetical protein
LPGLSLRLDLPLSERVVFLIGAAGHVAFERPEFLLGQRQVYASPWLLWSALAGLRLTVF